MKKMRISRCSVALVALACLVGNSKAEPSPGEQTFPVLTTRTASYTNAVVTSKTKNYIFVLHSSGMVNIKIDELTPELQEELGYSVPKPKQSTHVVLAKSVKDVIPANLNEKVKPLEDSLRLMQSNVLVAQQNIRANPKLLYAVLGVVALCYLFYCYCCHLICVKCKEPGGLLVWIPGFQMIPMFWAAGMSGWWFVLSWLPFVPILWAINIAKARGKSGWTALFLILPPTSLLAFLYLAFSGEPEPKIGGPRYKSMSLQTA